MPVFTLGLNHKTAPIEIREKFFLSATQQDLLLSELKCRPEIVEAFVISTCNRTELYVHTIAEKFPPQEFLQLIASVKKDTLAVTDYEYFYVYEEMEALTHLFMVACGLDSLIIGEKQILGQTKRAFELAHDKGLFQKHFNLLSNAVIRAGKLAHSETNISCGGSSVSWAAIITAERELGTLKDKSMLIVGAGKMSELAVGQITRGDFKNLYLINRTQKNAEDLSQKYGGEVVPFCDIKETLCKVDVCICAADAPHYLIEKPILDRVDLKERKLILIDISMPRNIDPEVSNIENVKLFYIDDLQKHLSANMRQRYIAVADVENIIERKLNEFYTKIDKMNSFLPKSAVSVSHKRICP